MTRSAHTRTESLEHYPSNGNLRLENPAAHLLDTLVLREDVVTNTSRELFEQQLRRSHLNVVSHELVHCRVVDCVLNSRSLVLRGAKTGAQRQVNTELLSKNTFFRKHAVEAAEQ